MAGSFLALTAHLLLGTPVAVDAAPPPVVAVVQTVAHPALDATCRGIRDGLRDAGYGGPEQLTWTFDCAQGSAAMAAQVAQKIRGQRPRVAVAVGTLAAQALRSALAPDVPIVFSSVTDPRGAGLLPARRPGLKGPRRAITGVSNFLPCDAQLRAYVEILPSLRRLGIIYNAGEGNAVAALDDVRRAAGGMGIELVTAQADRTAAVPAAAQALLGRVDAILVHNDNTALAALPAVTRIAARRHLPVFASDTDVVAQGAVAAYGPDQYALGRQTGAMVVAVLQGKAAVDIPVASARDAHLVVNPSAARRIGLTLPAAVLARARQVQP